MTMVGRTILAFDAAGRGCSAAIWRSGQVVAARREEMRRGQAERLVPLIEATLADAEVAYETLDALAVTTGPGGFTGVRIGLAAARGYALTLGLPVIGVSNFEVIAAATDSVARAGRTLLVAIDAKRTDIYAQAFDASLTPVSDPCAVAPTALAGQLPDGPLLLAGDAVSPARAALESAGREVAVDGDAELADPAVLVRLAAEAPLPAAGILPRPLYLRPPDVTLPKERA